MPEGFYKIEFADRAGTGSGVIVLMKGRVVGTDGSVHYDGTYACAGTDGQVQADIRTTVRPETELVRGFGPHSTRYIFSFTVIFPAAGSGSITVPTLSGPVVANISYLRPLP